MIKTEGAHHVFECGINHCPYERRSADPLEIKAVSAWHVYENHPGIWLSRMGDKRRPRLLRPKKL